MNEAALSEKEIALAAYNEVVEKAELGDIRLIGLDFKIRPSHFDEEGKKKRKAKFDCEIGHSFFEEGSIGGTFEWKVAIEQGRTKSLQVKASYLVIYDNVPSVDQVHAEAFFRKVGRFATYPYLRALVSQISWASRADLPVLPILR